MQNSFQIENPNPSFLETSRRDSWWIEPFFTAIGLLAFVVYSTWAAFQNEHYQWEAYLSPFYAPLLEYDWWPLSPAFLILWAPAGFRLTCYYYRKAYYRSLFLTPSACAVGGRPQNYRGERFLLLFQSRICTAISFTSLLSFALFPVTMSFSRSLLKLASA